jgi:PDZ domain
MHLMSTMISVMPSCGRLPLKALALAVGIWVCSGSSGMAQGGGDGPFGTGHGGDGPYPGFLGFGLSYHLGYGYGGYGLGVGNHGGYPYYGGRGYPHGEPILQRFGKISRLAYYGGPGYPLDGHSNYFEGIGPLVVDRPVAKVGENNDLSHVSDYGPFTGALPYPESLFAPYAAEAAGTGSSSGVRTSSPSRTAANNAPATTESTNLATQGRYLGIEPEPVVDANGVQGLKVADVFTGSAAEKAGLHAGDVIHSINGFLTTKRDDLAWIMANAAPDGVVKMSVRTASDGKVHTITAQLAVEPDNTSRPSYLPPAGNGPPPASR